MGEEDALNIDFANIEVIGDTDKKENLKSIETRTKTLNLDEILWSIGIDKEDFDLIKNSSRKRSLTPYKLEYTKLAQEQGYTLKEIAENINTTSATIGN